MEQNNSLWLLFLEGNKHAFSALFKYYYSNLYNYGIKISGNNEITEDCIQNLFVLLYEKRTDLGYVKNPNAYLFVSIKNSILKRIKKSKRTQELLEAEKLKDGFLFSPEDFLIKKESLSATSTALAVMINKLSNREREVIYLKYHSGLSNAEIAQVMDISLQSVANKIMKAMTKLREDALKNALRTILS